MRFTRTACAGGLLELDGVCILFDGVGLPVQDYPPTPPDILNDLLSRQIDLLAFSHTHPDHFSPAFVIHYLSRRDVFLAGPEDMSAALDDIPVEAGSIRLGDVTVTPLPCRHMGRKESLPHRAYLVEGSVCVLFLGDASPLPWRDIDLRPIPDVVIAPLGFALTEVAWLSVEHLRPGLLIMTHFSEEARDASELRAAARLVAKRHSEQKVVIPVLGETVEFHKKGIRKQYDV